MEEKDRPMASGRQFPDSLSEAVPKIRFILFERF